MPHPWPPSPLIYEIDTWVWLHDLSERYGRTITLDAVPPEEWDRLAARSFDGVWLMGVWERSPMSARIAGTQPELLREFQRVLPDFSPADVVGSPYSVHRYVVDEHLGGPEGLAAAREQLAARGLSLLLDFVPNHLALDHPLVYEHPEFFIQGSEADLARASQDFFRAGEKILAHGRDPSFDPWTDVAQVHAFHPGYRQWAVATLRDLARQADGVRCDMALLLVNRVFQRTWKERAGEPCPKEFWEEVIPAVRQQAPDFLFVAEVYWDMEAELLQQGFDYSYDKGFYDALVQGEASAVRDHLGKTAAFQDRLLRFIENHDENRAAATFAPEQARVAALALATVPGGKLFYEGQLEGRRIKHPVALRRRPEEAADRELAAFFARLLKEVGQPPFRQGEWRLCECRGWPDNPHYLNLLAWGWRGKGERRLIVINYAPEASQGRVLVTWEELAGRAWRLEDVFTGEIYAREGGEMRDPGLFVGLNPWQAHFFRVS